MDFPFIVYLVLDLRVTDLLTETKFHPTPATTSWPSFRRLLTNVWGTVCWSAFSEKDLFAFCLCPSWDKFHWVQGSCQPWCLLLIPSGSCTVADVDRWPTNPMTERTGPNKSKMRKRRKDRTSKYVFSKLSNFFRKESITVIHVDWWQQPSVFNETLEQTQPYPDSVSSSKKKHKQLILWSKRTREQYFIYKVYKADSSITTIFLI